MINVLRLREELKENDIIFSVIGCISRQMLEVIVETLRVKKSEFVGLEKEVNASIIVMIEMIENILKYGHAYNDNDAEKYGIVLLGKSDNSLVAFSSNLISKNQIPTLKEKISYINSLSREDLREEFRKHRRQPANENSTGAGLGFFEMAKISNQPIDFEFQSYDVDYEYFNLKVQIF